MTSERIVPRSVVREISTEETYPLRLMVLRPGGTISDLYWPEDGRAGHFHLGVVEGKEIICVGSFYPEPHPDIPGKVPFRLRGMATHPDHRNKGAGRSLVTEAFKLLRAHRCDTLWCNARLVAVPFYERLGFTITGPEFDIPKIGGHFRMWRSVR